LASATRRDEMAMAGEKKLLYTYILVVDMISYQETGGGRRRQWIAGRPALKRIRPFV
jgi:hypothetical protein